jgi:threonine/homoserine/homoserine lactone efflux protein
VLLKGFRFGMVLQLAIGPVCIFIFQIATLNGFYVAETGVLGVVVVDGIYILLAILGVATLIKSERIKSILKIFGAIVLFYYGLSMVLSFFCISLIPSLSIAGTSGIKGSFIHALVLTASNPLTILFWSGVFSTKIVEENLKSKDVYLFGIGALLSTLIFLSIVALSGNIIKPLFTSMAILILNFTVGVLLILFSIKSISKSNRIKRTGIEVKHLD